MTMVPSSLLRTPATIRPYSGTDGQGRPVYGTAVVARCRWEGRRRAVRTTTGTDVISSGSIIVRPLHDPPPQSQVVVRNRTYEVLDSVAIEGLSRPAGRELILG